MRDRALYSRYISRKFIRPYANDDDVFLGALIEIGKELDHKAVIYPTHDHHVRMLAIHNDVLNEYYLIAVNRETAEVANSKRWQYELCDQLDVPRPRTYYCESADDLEALFGNPDQIPFPWVIKPYARNEKPVANVTIRAEEIHSFDELEALLSLHPALTNGFLASEVIPGDPENIWAYTGYCAEPGLVLAGWTGHKLTQRPEVFGVFSTSETHINETVEQQGLLLLQDSKHVGIGQPEFKYDVRDQKYKLTEINPRAHMWHMTGYYGGVNLPLIQYYHMTGQQEACDALCRPQDPRPTRLVFMGSELANIVDHRPRRKYIMNALKALTCRRKHFIVWRWDDPFPFLYVFAASATQKFKRLINWFRSHN